MPSSKAGTGSATTTATSVSMPPAWHELRHAWQSCRQIAGKSVVMTFLGPLLIVYVVWGSTYLGLKVGLEAMPPLTLNAVRFLIAGALLFAYCRYRRWPMPDRRQWRTGAVLGLLLPAAGTGGATWAEQSLPSGTTALLLATIPLWIVVGRRLGDRGPITPAAATRPGARIAGGALPGRPSRARGAGAGAGGR